MNTDTIVDIDRSIEVLLEYITEARYKKFSEILQYRTRHIAILLENIYQPHNASAVLRSCDAYGIQDIHIVEQNNRFSPNQEIAMGSAKWVNVSNDYQNIDDAYTTLRKKGYKIVATSPEKCADTLDIIDISQPSVIVFGNELNGLTKEAIQNTDSKLYIPMFGFVESFNISVSVAIILSNLISRLHNSSIQWKLHEEDTKKILLQWLRLDVHKSSEIEKRMLVKYTS